MCPPDEIMTAGTETSVIVPEVWSSNYYDALLAGLPWNMIVSQDYQGEVSKLGDTVNISTFPEFDEAEEVGEDVKADASSITVTSQALVINKRIIKDFIVTDRALLQSLPMMDKLKELAVYSILKKMQSIIIAAISPSTSAPDHTIAYDTGTTLVLADILEAKELLDAQDVPASGRHGVMGAAQLNDIFNITGFTSSDFLVAGSPLATGQVPPLVGFNPHYTSVQGNTSYWCHESFMTMASQKGLTVKEYDRGAQGFRDVRVNCDTLFGLKQLDNTRIVALA